MQNGTVEMGHTALYYYIGKDPTWALFCATPFGLNTRQQNAWFYEGDGQKLIDEFGKKFNTYNLLMGNTGAQMGGWFNKEIKEVGDLRGLKMRIGGWAGRTLSKLGVVPQQIAGGDIYPALEKGTIDATEWVGPYDDEKLGFYKVAKFYYYPGWWEGGTANHTQVNLAKWNQLPKSYQASSKPPPARSTSSRPGATTRRNPAALKRLVAAGTQLRPFPQAVMEACLKASIEVNTETSAANADYKKVWDIDSGLPQRRVSLVAGGRIHLRHLHDPDPPAGLIRPINAESIGPGPISPGLFSFGFRELFRKIALSRSSVTG